MHMNSYIHYLKPARLEPIMLLKLPNGIILLSNASKFCLLAIYAQVMSYSIPLCFVSVHMISITTNFMSWLKLVLIFQIIKWII